MEFHISRAVREAAQLDDQLFSYNGNVVFANVAASRKLAEALNQARGPNADPAGAFNAGALFAMGLIDELSHALVAPDRRRMRRSPGTAVPMQPPPAHSTPVRSSPWASSTSSATRWSPAIANRSTPRSSPRRFAGSPPKRNRP